MSSPPVGSCRPPRAALALCLSLYLLALTYNPASARQLTSASPAAAPAVGTLAQPRDLPAPSAALGSYAVPSPVPAYGGPSPSHPAASPPPQQLQTSPSPRSSPTPRSTSSSVPREDPLVYGKYDHMADSSVVPIHMLSVPGTSNFLFMERPSGGNNLPNIVGEDCAFVPYSATDRSCLATCVGCWARRAITFGTGCNCVASHAPTALLPPYPRQLPYCYSVTSDRCHTQSFIPASWRFLDTWCR